MKRLLGLALLTLTLTFSTAACKSGGDPVPTPEPAPAAPEQPQMSNAEALVGSWTDGKDTLTFNADKSYVWKKSMPCGAPPCPSTQEAGTYMLRSNKIYLDPSQGTDEQLQFGIDWNPRSLKLNSNKRGKSWTLNYK